MAAETTHAAIVEAHARFRELHQRLIEALTDTAGRLVVRQAEGKLRIEVIEQHLRCSRANGRPLRAIAGRNAVQRQSSSKAMMRSVSRCAGGMITKAAAIGQAMKYAFGHVTKKPG